MSKICPICKQVHDDDEVFCGYGCGVRLIPMEEDVNPALNLGDANAISGGVSINQSKNISTQETHFHSTTVERVKSESELKLEASNQLRAKAEEIMAERGRIDSVAMNQLRPLSKQLGIDEETFKSIIKDVRSNRNGAISGLSAANARYLQQAQQAVKTNDMDALSNLTPRLEAMAAISQDDNVQFMYYLTLSILYPIKSMEVYERQMDENYWRTFWAIISYIRTGKHAEATKVLALFDPLRYEKSEEDQNLLEAYFNIMKEDKDGAQEFLDEILGEPTEQVKPLLRAVESTQYEEEPESLEVRFYMERVMSKSDVVVKSQKKTETPATKEEPAKTEPKPDKKAEPQPKAKAEETPAHEIKKDNKEAEELYAKACAASGAKRVMLLQKAADAGSLEAMYDLSDCYYDGEGVEKNMPLAIKWITKAADAGYVKAQTALGATYFQGMEGLDQNYALSEKYLLMAANKDNTDAQAFLAYLFIAMEDYSKAMVWARKAAQMEHPQACFALGRIYDEGLGVEVNHKEGLKWYEKAANGGDADAQNIVGNIYTDADFVKHDYKKAFENYQKAASQGHLYGMLNLGLCYQDGQGTDMDIIAAENWIRKAADGGLQDAIDILSSNPIYNSQETPAMLDDSCDISDEETIKLYEQVKNTSDSDALLTLQNASDRNNPSALCHLGLLYLEGTGVKKDLSLAIDLLEKAVSYENAKAMNILAICYQFGNGVKANEKKAMDLYKQAAELGYSSAMENLGNLCADRQDYKTAIKWYKKAIDSGVANAYAKMGHLYCDGLGFDLNFTEAVVNYNKGADAGDAECMKALGYCYLNGNGVTQNLSEAKSWFLKAAQINSEKVIFFNAYAEQGDKNRIDIHLSFQVNDYKNKKIYVRYTTDLVNTGDILSEYDYEIKPEHDQCEWQDFVYNLFENNQKWPNADLLLNLRTTIKVLDSSKEPISEETILTYNARHKIRIFHENELLLGFV